MKKPRLLDLRPTQFVLGMKEVEYKVTKLKTFNEKQMQKYCDDHQIPVVIGPHQEMFLIDHHHFARACWEQDVSQYSVKIIKDLSGRSENEFWNVMRRQKWMYLHDQFGLGPHPPQALPSDIRGLADDPYRSLAWAVLDRGGFKKQDIPFFEFSWAAYFRFNLDFRLHSKSNFKEAIAISMKLAKLSSAKDLPGFLE